MLCTGSRDSVLLWILSISKHCLISPTSWTLIYGPWLPLTNGRQRSHTVCTVPVGLQAAVGDGEQNGRFIVRVCNRSLRYCGIKARWLLYCIVHDVSEDALNWRPQALEIKNRLYHLWSACVLKSPFSDCDLIFLIRLKGFKDLSNAFFPILFWRWYKFYESYKIKKLQ